MRHMHRECAVAHRLGASLGNLIEKLVQGPAVTRAQPQDAKYDQLLVRQRILADGIQPSHRGAGPRNRNSTLLNQNFRYEEAYSTTGLRAKKNRETQRMVLPGFGAADAPQSQGLTRSPGPHATSADAAPACGRR